MQRTYQPLTAFNIFIKNSIPIGPQSRHPSPTLIYSKSRMMTVASDSEGDCKCAQFLLGIFDCVDSKIMTFSCKLLLLLWWWPEIDMDHTFILTSKNCSMQSWQLLYHESHSYQEHNQFYFLSSLRKNHIFPISCSGSTVNWCWSESMTFIVSKTGWRVLNARIQIVLATTRNMLISTSGIFFESIHKVSKQIKAYVAALP